jgi:hyperosmotically inducible protein
MEVLVVALQSNAGELISRYFILGGTMKRLILIAAVALGAGQITASYAQTPDDDADRSHPKTFVKDSVITTKIKTTLAAQHVGSLMHIKVDTDDQGVVWLSGKAKTQDDIDAAISIARATKGVRDVRSDIRLAGDL